MDLLMPEKGGIEGMPALPQALPTTKVLVLSMQDEPRYVRAAFDAGASGYVLKEAAESDLVAAIREVAERRPLRPPDARRADDRGGGSRTTTGPGGSAVRTRARGLKLLALGQTNQEIASILFISVRTAETHRAHIMQKLGLSNRAAPVRYALSQGLLDEESTS